LPDAATRAKVDAMRSAARTAVLAAFLAGIAACGGSGRREGAAPPGLPASLTSSWELFARRCSKCHALARPLDSGIDDDEHWRAYVERMRLTPGSGISLADEAEILRFLRFYAAEQRDKRDKKARGRAPRPAEPADGGTP
jgi:hypothetical protein